MKENPNVLLSYLKIIISALYLIKNYFRMEPRVVILQWCLTACRYLLNYYTFTFKPSYCHNSVKKWAWIYDRVEYLSIVIQKYGLPYLPKMLKIFMFFFRKWNIPMPAKLPHILITSYLVLHEILSFILSSLVPLALSFMILYNLNK